MAHEHSQSRPPSKTVDKAFLIAILLNGLFVGLQLVYAGFAHSTSLFADAIHNLGDVLGLILAWLATRLMRRKPTIHSTYGMKKTSIFAALLNGSLLIFSCGIILTDALFKLMSPVEINGLSVMVVAALGIVVNGVTALFFYKGSHDLNIRGAFLHLFADALISVGVVVSSIVLLYTHWLWIDPLMGILIAAIILKGTWSLFADSFRLMMDGVPATVSWQEVEQFLSSCPGVEGVHDLHIWALSTQENALSVHLYMPKTSWSEAQRLQYIRQLKTNFDIAHITIQIEETLLACQEFPPCL
ncbi:MAG: cation transporter [Legionella sp.]|nr:MAG: cation transporter [Legionella sp.]PJE00036.1 MAG: cation transporter [Legionella sp.]